MQSKFIYLLLLCIVLSAFKKGFAKIEAKVNTNEPLSRADRLEQIGVLQDRVYRSLEFDCLKEGNINASGTIEQARVAKEKVKEAKKILESAETTEAKSAALEQMRLKIAEAKAILSKAVENINNMKASCQKNSSVTLYG